MRVWVWVRVGARVGVRVRHTEHRPLHVGVAARLVAVDEPLGRRRLGKHHLVRVRVRVRVGTWSSTAEQASPGVGLGRG